MDATNISKLTAYYSLYSKTAQFIDMASYLLFREIQPVGASPVSIPGINYDLNKALFPNPEQIIPLQFDQPQDETSSEGVTPEPAEPPEFKVGDVIPLRTGIIFDNNGNPVPDGTPVDFVQTLIGEASSTRQSETTTGGIARTTFAVSVPGTLEFLAESEPAQSETLRIDIPSPDGEVTPTTEILIFEITPSPTATEEIIIPPVKPPIEPEVVQYPRISDWVIASLISIGIAWILYRLAAFMGLVKWGVRTGLLALIGGLIAYSILAYQMPTNENLILGSISRSVFLFTVVGIIIGAIIAILWRSIADRQVKKVSMNEKT
jgi:beta-N-acetylhexosaminidase